MKDVADDLALIVRNAIAYIKEFKELERQIHESRRAAEPVAWQWRKRSRRWRPMRPRSRGSRSCLRTHDVVRS